MNTAGFRRRDIMNYDSPPIESPFQCGDRSGEKQPYPSTSGQGLIEYALLVALAAVVVVGGATLLAGGVEEAYRKSVAAIAGDLQPTTVPHQPSPTPAGPMEVSARVVNDSGAGLSDVPVSVFLNDRDYYTGLTQTTDTGGDVTFSLPAGTYLLRADHLGRAYWSEALTTPPGASATIQVSICQEITLGEVSFPDRGNPVDGMLVVLRVNNNSGQELNVTQVTIDWAYLRSLPEEPGGKMRIYGAYLCPGDNPNCNVANRRRWFNNLSPGWGTDMNVTTTPTTVNKNPQPLPTNGGYITFDFDSKDYMDRRSLAAAPWYVVSGDFGFAVTIDGCPSPITKPAVHR
jgi:Flp pilus assembly pilin Flp